MIELYTGFDTLVAPIFVNLGEFDSYPIPTGNSETGRFGGYSTYNFQAYKTLSRISGPRIVGLAVYPNNGYPLEADTQGLITFWDDDNYEQIYLRFLYDGSLAVYSGNHNGTGIYSPVLLAKTSINIMVVNAWQYIEFSATIGVNGSFEVRLGQQTILSGSGVNTMNPLSTNANTNRVQIYSYGASVFLDDLYILNTSGSYNNGFLGEQKVLTTVPASNVSVQFLSNGTAGNWQNLQTNDGDVTYNYSATSGDTDYFNMLTLGSYESQSFKGNEIQATKTTIIARKDDVGERDVANIVTSGMTVDQFNDNVLLSTYQSFSNYMEVDPATDAPWTPAAVNALEVGYKLTA
jgi:hypothetical protein